MVHQTAILKNPSRFKVVCCGRRFGKTLLSLIALVAGHGNKERKLKGLVDNSVNLWWVAPNYPMTTIIWRHLKRALYDCAFKISETERKITLPHGSSIMIKSADNEDGLRGEGLDGVVIDESARVKKTAWIEGLRPALSDKQGWAIFISTPKGFNWFHDLFLQAGNTPDWARWQRPSSDNPKITQEELDKARNELGELMFAQEYLAQFISIGAGMLKREWFDIVQVIPPNCITVRFWDLASTIDGDYTVGIKMSKSIDNVYFIEDMVRGRWTPGQRDQIILQTARIDTIKTRIIVEQEPGSSGVSQIESLKKLLTGFYLHGEKSTGDKTTRASPFASQCEIKNVKLVQGIWIQDFFDELETFPEGEHDDIVDACSGAFSYLTSKNLRETNQSMRKIEYISKDDIYNPDEDEQKPGRFDGYKLNKPR